MVGRPHPRRHCRGSAPREELHALPTAQGRPFAYTEKGTHDSLGDLPEPLVDVIHRIVTDPGRLSRTWCEEMLASGLSDGEYVETIGVIACVLAVDQCRRGIGMAPHPLPEPGAGEPTRVRPQGAKPGAAWVPLLAPEDVSEAEADLYPDLPLVTYVLRALSLVPEETRAYNELSHEQYTPAGASWDFDPAGARNLLRPAGAHRLQGVHSQRLLCLNHRPFGEAP